MGTVGRRRKVTLGTAYVAPVSGASRYYRSSTISIELPRGVSSNHDVLYDEATNTLSTVGGAEYSYLWDWNDQRVNAARHLAIPGAKRLTVAGSGATAWTNFLAAIATAQAGTGDYEILIPALMTMPSGAPADTGWLAPTGAGRRLYITYSGALPTADVMPTEAQMDAVAIIETPTSLVGDSVFYANSAASMELTWTGVTVRVRGDVLYQGVFELRNPTATTLADMPKRWVFDRFKIDGDYWAGSSGIRRGMLLNAPQVAMLNCWVTGIKYAGAETNGIGGYSGAKYQVFRDVMCEAMSICRLYGGNDPTAPGTGVLDPSDNLDLRVCSNKKLSWMSSNAYGGPDGGIKNGFESKNCVRWFVLDCITHRHQHSGQTHPMIMQNLQDNGDSNGLANHNNDIAVVNHEFKDCGNGLTLVSRVQYGSSTLPNASERMAFVNFRFTGLGKSWGLKYDGGTPSRGRVLDISGDFLGLLVDKWTWIETDSPFTYITAEGTGATGVTLTNFAGKRPDFLRTSMSGSGATAILAAFSPTRVYGGQMFYGSSEYGSSVGAVGEVTTYASAVAAGFNATTGVLSAPSNDDGVSGSTPGVDATVLDAALLSMQPWAFSR